MSVKAINSEYKKVAYHLLEILYHTSGANYTIATIGFLIALSKKRRLYDYMDDNMLDYIFHEKIQLDNNTAVCLHDIGQITPSSHDVSHMIRIMDTIPNLDHAKLFEEVINLYSNQEGRKTGNFSQPAELTHVVTAILNEYNVSNAYNPFAGMGSYQLENRAIDFFLQEINFNTCLIGKLRMYINDVQTEYACEDSLSHWGDRNRKFDSVVATPPFRMPVDDGRYKLSYWEDHRFRHKTVESLFFSRAINSIKDDGVVVGIVPTIFLYDSTYSAIGFRKHLIEDNWVKEIIQLPASIFSATAISTAIVVLSKSNNKHIKFIDASQCFIKEGKHNILDIKKLIRIRETNAEDVVCNVDCEKVISNECNLTPSIYFEAEEITPEGYKSIQLNDIASVMTGMKLNLETDGVCINVSDLSSDGLNCQVDVSSIAVSVVKDSFKCITSHALLISKIRTLKPTYIKASEDMPIYISPNIMALKVDESSIYIPYLAYELSKKSEKLQKGAVIPNFRSSDILKLRINIPDLSSQKDCISQEKALWQSLIEEDKKSKIKKFGLEEYIEAQKSEYMSEVLMRKHDMKPYLRELGATAELLQYFITNNSVLEHIEAISDIVRDQNLAISKLNRLIDTLSDEDVFGVPEKVNICNFLIQQEKYSPANTNCKIVCNIDTVGVAEYRATVSLNEDLVMRELFVNIAQADLECLTSNIISNAIEHGGVMNSEFNLIITISLGIDVEKNMFQIDFSNNGKPFPDGLTKELYGRKGEKAGATGNSGVGGYRVRSIVQHYGGDYDIFNDGTSDMWATVRVYLPIFLEDEHV